MAAPTDSVSLFSDSRRAVHQCGVLRRIHARSHVIDDVLVIHSIESTVNILLFASLLNNSNCYLQRHLQNKHQNKLARTLLVSEAGTHPHLAYFVHIGVHHTMLNLFIRQTGGKSLRSRENH
jgi:hypothetical protein